MNRTVRTKPYYVELETDRSYVWCACGRSRNQPWCDGSHRGTGTGPVTYRATRDNEEALFCGCKKTATPPFCDGAHNSLADVYPSDDPHSEKNRAVPEVRRHPAAAMLNGGCYVVATRHLPLQTSAGYRWGETVGASLGAVHQSQFYFETACLEETSQGSISFGDRSVVLFIAQGEARLRIGTQTLVVPEHAGVSILPGEAFSIRPASTGVDLKFFATVGPRAAAPEFLTDAEPGPDDCGSDDRGFDIRYPVRVAAIDPGKRSDMADRFFQILVDKSLGSPMLTQFIGMIPLSKAAPHRHLYEESLIVLSGTGCLWTDNLKTPVTAGDVIFLPHRQLHSLECTDSDGMFVVGVIYPGDNPAVNY